LAGPNAAGRKGLQQFFDLRKECFGACAPRSKVIALGMFEVYDIRTFFIGVVRIKAFVKSRRA